MYYSSTNSVANHAAFCTSTAIVDSECSNSTQSASTGLSTGAKAGAAVGAIAGAVGVTALIVAIVKLLLSAKGAALLTPAAVSGTTPSAPTDMSQTNPAAPSADLSSTGPVSGSEQGLTGSTATSGLDSSGWTGVSGLDSSGWTGVSGPENSNWTGVSGAGSIPSLPVNLSEPFPLVFGAYRRDSDRRQHGPSAINRKPVATPSSPSHPSISEVEGASIPQLGTTSATISPMEDIERGSWGYLRYEVGGSEVHEASGEVRRVEAPDGARRFEAPG